MKNLIIKEFKNLIRKNGFDFTIAEIAGKLGISKSTVYNHFASKEDVIKYIILEMKEESDRDQLSLLKNNEIDFIEKLKQLLTMLPSDYDLINPITMRQLRRKFPEIYQMVGEIYHKDWDRFNSVYSSGVEAGLLKPIDLVFFKEMYIVAITHLPEVPAMSEYNHKQLLNKIVDQLFAGIGYV
jgi:AcrR family transcriptional regulator